MKKTVDELLKTFGEIIGERNDETVIGFMEDISDSYNTETPTDEYREKYEDLLARYRARFYDKEERETETVEKPDDMKDTVEEYEKTTYEDIFKED